MNNTTKTILGIIILALIIWGITSLSDSESTTAEPIKIGGIFALSGVGTAVGEEERRGAELAIEEINASGGVLGRLLEFIVEDVSLDKMKVAGSVAHKLIDIDKVVAIVGPQWAEPTAAIIPIIEKAQVPTVGIDATHDIETQTKSSYFFSTWYDNQVGIDIMLQFIQDRGWTNIAIIRPVDGGYWEYTRNLFRKSAPAYNVLIIDDINLGNPLTQDFRTPLVKIKSKNPDAIFIVVTDPTECPFMRQAQELGVNVPILSLEASGNYASLAQCPQFLENLYFSTPAPNESSEKFIQKFIERYGREPQYPSAVTSYDAVRVIAHALEETNLEGGEALRDAISETNIDGFSLPTITFDDNGFVVTPSDAFEIQTVRDGQFVKYE